MFVFLGNSSMVSLLLTVQLNQADFDDSDTLKKAYSTANSKAQRMVKGQLENLGD